MRLSLFCIRNATFASELEENVRDLARPGSVRTFFLRRLRDPGVGDNDCIQVDLHFKNCEKIARKKKGESHVMLIN